MQTLPSVFQDAPEAIAEAAAAYTAAVERHYAAHGALVEAKAAATAAAEKRQRDVARAVAEGTALGTDAAVKKANDALEAAKAAVKESERQALAANGNVTRAAARHAEAWRVQLAADDAARSAAVIDAGQQFLAAVAALRDVVNVAAWVDRAVIVAGEASYVDRMPAVTSSTLGVHDPADRVSAFLEWLERDRQEAPFERVGQTYDGRDDWNERQMA